jgi:zinc finger MYND domain-containing protein 10
LPLTFLTTSPEKKVFKRRSAKQMLNRTPKQELQDQYYEMEFKLGMCTLSIVRFLTDHTSCLQVSALHHLVCQQDFLCILVPLIEIRPWIREVKRTEKGEKVKVRQKFEKNDWKHVARKEYSRVVKLEAQVWIAIYNLFMDVECRKKYEFNEFRKSNILRLKKFMNELLLDQIPVLTTMLRPLEELRMMNAPPMSNMQNFVVETLPELVPKLTKGRNWNQIAEYQLKTFFKKQSKKQIKR